MKGVSKGLTAKQTIEGMHYIYIYIYIPTYRPTDRPIDRPTYLPTYLPTCPRHAARRGGPGRRAHEQLGEAECLRQIGNI